MGCQFKAHGTTAYRNAIFDIAYTVSGFEMASTKPGKHFELRDRLMAMVARKNEIDDWKVLGKALFSAGEDLGFSQTEAVAIIGRERTGVVRDGIDPNSKSGELALMFIRIYRELYAVVSGDQENMRHWMETDNQYFRQPPRKMMESCQGLVRVLMYLDAARRMPPYT